ncbi:MAG: hypothetical protein EBS22_05265 [Acidimicrobiia bacterium]|nr:hypothetical protein [Acidimicrobiia bacterium]
MAVTFVLVAFVLFVMLKLYNRAVAREEVGATPVLVVGDCQLWLGRVVAFVDGRRAIDSGRGGIVAPARATSFGLGRHPQHVPVR